MNDTEIEVVARAIWNSESLRGSGRLRTVDWKTGVAESDKDGYRLQAKHVLEKLRNLRRVSSKHLEK